MNAFAYHSEADNAREHWEHESGARHDHYSEAYGAEIRAIEAADEYEHEYNEALAAQEAADAAGLTLAEWKAQQERTRLIEEALKRHAPECIACIHRIDEFFIPF